MGGLAELSAQAGDGVALWALCGTAALGALTVAARVILHALSTFTDLDFQYGYDASAGAIEGARLYSAQA